MQEVARSVSPGGAFQGGSLQGLFSPAEDFSFNASEYTEEELAGKRHNFELVKCDSNVICIDSKMMGVGSSSCGPALADKYRLDLKNLNFDFFVSFSKK